jgi:hypothetical protein
MGRPDVSSILFSESDDSARHVLLWQGRVWHIIRGWSFSTMCGLDLTKYKEVVMTITTRPRLDGYPLCKTCARADLAQMEREMKAWESSLA